jgi:ABC-type tungstate transport system substrate-binding protein
VLQIPQAALKRACRCTMASVMDPLRELGKVLVTFGIVLAGAGVFVLIGGKLPFRLGHLPGDIAYQGRNGSFYFPIVTCLLLSAVLTLLFWIANLFHR